MRWMTWRATSAEPYPQVPQRRGVLWVPTHHTGHRHPLLPQRVEVSIQPRPVGHRAGGAQVEMESKI